ncbi:hypothetical protein HZH66_005580 [Vespula vulgaris]|uniref:Uncharacterized protein n=1 Tax=Vespula vulgaris TaxID=7454 RepID=A0A834KAL6_VESVU|nr:hypothetical protein HZH66_005580 [Vespula vulgaris]
MKKKKKKKKKKKEEKKEEVEKEEEENEENEEEEVEEEEEEEDEDEEDEEGEEGHVRDRASGISSLIAYPGKRTFNSQVRLPSIPAAFKGQSPRCRRGSKATICPRNGNRNPAGRGNEIRTDRMWNNHRSSFIAKNIRALGSIRPANIRFVKQKKKMRKKTKQKDRGEVRGEVGWSEVERDGVGWGGRKNRTSLIPDSNAHPRLPVPHKFGSSRCEDSDAPHTKAFSFRVPHG